MNRKAFKGVEVFRAGEHVDSAGRRHTFTEADLDTIAAYDPSRHEAPVVIGHPADNAPAWGWVERVYRAGATLKADFKDVAPQFADLVEAGRFKKRSISLYPDGSLRHVGFLGARPPAVKGLRDVAFAEGEARTFEFGEGEDFRLGAVGRILVGLRDWLIEKFGREEADKIVNSWDLETALDKPDPEPGPAFEEEGSMSKEALGRLAALEARLAEFTDAATAKDKEISDLRAANMALSGRVDATVAAGRRAGLSAFCEALASEGRLTEHQARQAVQFMERLDAATPVEFGEGEDTVKKPAVDAFKAFLESLPVQVEFGEIATSARAATAKPSATDRADFGEHVDPERLALHRKALEFAEANKVPYAEALASVVNQGA